MEILKKLLRRVSQQKTNMICRQSFVASIATGAHATHVGACWQMTCGGEGFSTVVQNS